MNSTGFFPTLIFGKMIPASLLVAILFIIAGGCLYRADAAPNRDRRALWQLDTFISCYTGRSGFVYNGYGCWCGLGGSGRPLDGSDRCCMGHDYCYQTVQDNRCGVYFSSYQYTETNCDGPPGTGFVTCTSDNDCERELCECDRRLAQCLLDNTHTYNDAFANFEKRFCDVRLGNPIMTYGVDTSLSSSSSSTSNSTITVVGGNERDAYRVDGAPAGVIEHGVGLQQLPQQQRQAVDKLFNVDGANPENQL